MYINKSLRNQQFFYKQTNIKALIKKLLYKKYIYQSKILLIVSQKRYKKKFELF